MYPLPDLVLALLLAVDFLYDPEDDLRIVPLPDLILGLAVDFLADEPPLDATYPLPERLTLPDALAALIPVARDLDFVVLLTNPLPDLVLGLLLVPDILVAVIFLVPVPLPVDIVLPTFFLAWAFLYFEPAHADAFLTFLVPVPLPVVTLTMIMRSN